MNWNPRLWRMAQRIEAAYRRHRGTPPSLDAPWYAWQRLTETCRLATMANLRGWRHAHRRQHEQLGRDLDYLLGELRALRSSLERRQRDRLPLAAELYAELVAAEDEFGGIAVDDFELYVTTEPITLESIYLGPFEIRLNLSRLAESDPYRVVALEPHPAQSSGETHPHVHNERICLGEGKAAVTAALAEGRLADLFQVMNRVLHTYGEGSAYVELDRWYGTPCRECDAGVDDDDVYTCRSCESALCGECVRLCQHCDSAACHDCATICYSCEETVCSRCLSTCSGCEEEFCTACFAEGLCHACQATEEAREAEQEEFADDDTATTVHADRLGETAVLARPRHHRNRRLRNLGRPGSAAH